jgi:small subunit ribosomal protein S8
MSITDPIADMLTRIRNAIMARHDSVLIPASKTKISIAHILKEEGFITDYEVVKGDTPQRVIKIQLKYTGKKEPILTGLKRVSKPGLRVYVGKGEIPRIYEGLGITILSTPSGVMTGRQAWRKGVGGEVLCYIW